MEILRSYDRGKLGSDDLHDNIIHLFEDESLEVVVKIGQGKGAKQALDTVAIVLSSR